MISAAIARRSLKGILAPADSETLVELYGAHSEAIRQPALDAALKALRAHRAKHLQGFYSFDHVVSLPQHAFARLRCKSFMRALIER
jgi:hypothetical protein